MAEQLVGRFVVDHGHAALLAFEHLAAVLALGHSLVTPAVEQQNGLLACLKVVPDGILHGKADLPGVAGGKLGPHIHDLDFGQRVAAIAFGQAHQLGAAMLGGIIALGAGGGAGQQKQGPVLRRALPGHLVGRVAGRGFGAVGVLLLLINDDKADVFQRGEDRAAGAHHDIRAAVLDHLPLEQALGVVEGGMLHGHPFAKLAFQPQDHLRGQADLRHQHQRPAAHLQAVLNELQEHQRFAAAGHAVEQGRVRGCILQPGQQRVIGGLLLLREKDGLVLQRDGRIQVDGFVHLAAFQHALGAEVIQHRPADTLFLQCRQGALTPGQQGHCGQLLGGRSGLWGQRAHQLVGIFRVANELLLKHRGHAVLRHGGLVLRAVGDDRLDGLVVGAEGALLQKVHQPQQLRGEAGRGRGHIEQELELCALRFGIAGQHHTHPGTAPPPEGHQHHAAQPDGILLVGHDGIGIEFVEMKGRVAHCNAYRFGHSGSSFKAI